ncbi:beta-N-acetylhexosaminidase [Paenibacillus mendelii]|uniref:beta-N-acetylhexosaminidase n=1 Tax=Paenibacillus mendelii TaxID=206163 RepID=A0ABV6J3P8_9BACL|nr:beta-N-acetylhexosaminidase [Paenibacillus mendelii]MCQ6561968.1 beta-N-acetylhexosaminidase [Paenibacillus mendelii]
MKRRQLWIIAAILLLSVGIIGCAKNGNQAVNQGNHPIQPGESNQQQPAEPPTGNTGVTGNSGNTGNTGNAGNTGAGNDEDDRNAEPEDGLLRQALAKMSLDEKIGQLIIAGVEGTSANDKDKRMIAEQHVGGIIFYKDNLASPKEVVKYVNKLKEWNGAGAAPLLLSVDQEGGKVSRLPGLEALPSAAVIGAADELPFASAVGSLLARESEAMGINMDFAPVLDINSNPDNPVIGTRSYGSTADKVTTMGMAVMGAIRGEGVIPVVKHFPGHGDTSVDSHLELPVVHKDLEQLKAFEWLPFAEAIHQGTDAVMIAHILFPKLDDKYPASLSKAVITGQLRGTLGFEGVVMTDDMTMGAIAKNFGIGEAAVQTIKAGSDIVLVAHEYGNVDKVIQALKKSVGKGELTEQRIDESVLRILELKQRYELTDEPVAAPALGELNAEIRSVLKQYTK